MIASVYILDWTAVMELCQRLDDSRIEIRTVSVTTATALVMSAGDKLGWRADYRFIGREIGRHPDDLPDKTELDDLVETVKRNRPAVFLVRDPRGAGAWCQMEIWRIPARCEDCGLALVNPEEAVECLDGLTRCRECAEEDMEDRGGER